MVAVVPASSILAHSRIFPSILYSLPIETPLQTNMVRRGSKYAADERIADTQAPSKKAGMKGKMGGLLGGGGAAGAGGSSGGAKGKISKVS
jgi:hypothetical protein